VPAELGPEHTQRIAHAEKQPRERGVGIHLVRTSLPLPLPIDPIPSQIGRYSEMKGIAAPIAPATIHRVVRPIRLRPASRAGC
jgi:hypothetical protein